MQQNYTKLLLHQKKKILLTRKNHGSIGTKKESTETMLRPSVHSVDTDCAVEEPLRSTLIEVEPDPFTHGITGTKDEVPSSKIKSPGIFETYGLHMKQVPITQRIELSKNHSIKEIEARRDAKTVEFSNSCVILKENPSPTAQ